MAYSPATRITKKEAALKVYADEIVRVGGKPIRKKVIDRFMDEVNLTKAGASTYYQNIRNILK